MFGIRIKDYLRRLEVFFCGRINHFHKAAM